MMPKGNLWKLRKEIKLGSLFFSNYRNSFGIDPHKVCDFFDGFLEFVEEEMREDHPGFNDKDFWELLPDYDTPEQLLDWYYCFEEDPLPVPAVDKEEDEDDEHA